MMKLISNVFLITLFSICSLSVIGQAGHLELLGLMRSNSSTSLNSNSQDTALLSSPVIVKSSHVSKNFIYSKYYGKICQWETRRDNRIGQKIRFRLGSVEYVDKFESKY